MSVDVGAISSEDEISSADKGESIPPPAGTTASKLSVKKMSRLPERPKQSDLAGFWMVWQQNRDYLLRCCLRWMNGNPADAEDALSQACIKAYLKLVEQGSEIKNLRGWLTRLTYNVCLDSRRESQRYREAIKRLHEFLLAQNRYHHKITRGEEDILLFNEFIGRLRTAIAGLRCRLQLPAAMHFLEEMSYPEIAQRLKISTANARKRIQHARAQLKTELMPYLGNNGRPELVQDDHNPEKSEYCEISQSSGAYFELLNETIQSPSQTHQMIAIKTKNNEPLQLYLPVGMIPKRLKQRITSLRKYCQKHPKTLKKCLELANLLYAAGHWEEAIEHYQQIITRRPEFFQLRLRLGKMLRLLGREDDAINSFLQARRTIANPASRFHLTGLIRLCRKSYDSAKKAFRRAADHEPGNAAHWHAMGIVCLHNDQPQDAMNAFETALAIDPNDLSSRIHLSDALMMLDHKCTAYRHIKHALAVTPNDVLVLIKLADFRVMNGLVHKIRGMKTKRIIRQAQALAPDSIDARKILAEYHQKKGNVEKATALLQATTQNHQELS